MKAKELPRFLTAVLAALTLSFGCADSAQKSTEPARVISLASTDIAGTDLLTFAQRQRSFLQAVSAGSIGQVGALVRQDFIVFDAMPPDSIRRRRPLQTARFPDAWLSRSSFTADYLRFLRDELQLVYSENSRYRLLRRTARATVITHPPDGAPYLTGWDSTSTGWKVTSVTVHLTPQGLAEIEKALRGESNARPSR